MGNEEFIYIPCMLACYMGEGIQYQSTTRSPIMTSMRQDYPIHTAIAYKKPEDRSILNYLYNIELNLYEEIFWFFEKDVKQSFKDMMQKALGERGVKYLHFVVCDQVEGESV